MDRDDVNPDKTCIVMDAGMDVVIWSSPLSASQKIRIDHIKSAALLCPLYMPIGRVGLCHSVMHCRRRLATGPGQGSSP